MKNRIVLLTLLGALSLTGRAAIAPESVLPANTFAVATVPDMNAVRAAIKAAPMSRLWNDPAMAEFSAKFEDAIDANVLEPLLLFADFDPKEYTSLFQGQLTFALTRNAGEEIPGMVFLMDSGKAKAEALAEKLTDLHELLLENELLNDKVKIGGVEFIHIASPDAEGPIQGLFLGQSGSLLIGASTRELAGQVVALHQKKAKKSLQQNEGFANRHRAQFKGALGYAWLDFTVVMEIAEEQIEKNADPENKPGPLEPTPDKILSALGLKGLRSISLSIHQDKQGELAQMYLDVPKAGRRGLFAMLAAPGEDAGPPPFVGANVAGFARWRQDGAQLWKLFDDIANEITPLAAGVLGGAETAVRATQPEFKLKENLIDILGDDFIAIEQGPKGNDLEDFITPSSLYLFKSIKPAVANMSIRQIVASLTEDEPEKREFAGRAVYSWFIQAGINEQAVHLTTAGEYVVVSTDEKILEQYLKGPNKDAQKLADLPGLKAAAEKVGGFNSGAFAYENQVPVARALLGFVKGNPDFLNDLIGQFGGELDPAEGLNLVDWLDFKLLPDFKKISKYFHFTVSGVKVTKQGINLRMYAPTPPALKK
jgi:hypothetical protein